MKESVLSLKGITTQHWFDIFISLISNIRLFPSFAFTSGCLISKILK